MFKVPPGGGAAPIQKALRVMSILVAIGGLSFLGWRYLNRPTRETSRPTVSKSDVRVTKNVDEDEGVLIDMSDPNGFAAAMANRDKKPPVTPVDKREIEAIVGLDSVVDGADLEPDPLYYLLTRARDDSPANNLFVKRKPIVKLSDLRADPDKYRNEVVAVRGRLLRLEESLLPRDNPSGLKRVYEGSVLVSTDEGMCMFIAAKRPDRAVENQYVEVRGIFMKLLTYATNDGGSAQAPLVIISEILPSRAPGGVALGDQQEVTTALGVLVAVLIGAVLLYVGLMVYLRKRQGAKNPTLDGRRMVRRMMREQDDGSPDDGEPDEEEREEEEWR